MRAEWNWANLADKREQVGEASAHSDFCWRGWEFFHQPLGVSPKK